MTTVTALLLAGVCPPAVVTLYARNIEPGALVGPRIHRWAHGRIPYTFAPDFPDLTRARVDSAIALIQSRAFGVTFTPRVAESDYVLFRAAGDCLSEAEGRVEGESVVWLSDTCGMGGVIHELLHVLGFRHEQNRCDRDRYVSIIWANIEPTKLARHQFEKRCSPNDDLGSYDEASIMHYSDTAFAVTRDAGGALLKTMLSRRGLGPLMGQKDSLSTQDIRTINLMYPPQVTDVAVTYRSGLPTVSWSAVRAALSYSVTIVAVYTGEGYPSSFVRDATPSTGGSITEASFVDTQRSYTGLSRCHGSRYTADYYYEVTAIYPGGIISPATRVPAMVTPEGRC